jgi:LysM repeat protein
VQSATATQLQVRIPRYLAPAALASALTGIVLVAAISVGSARTQSSHASSVHRIVRRGPGYWTVHHGDTYARISKKTGLSIDQLEALNPDTDPYSLAPGQRLKLSLHPPPPRPKPPPPRYWTVRPGESFGSIAAKTEINLAKLEQLNPGLKPTTLQPGDRIRLRR